MWLPGPLSPGMHKRYEPALEKRQKLYETQGDILKRADIGTRKLGYRFKARDTYLADEYGRRTMFTNRQQHGRLCPS